MRDRFESTAIDAVLAGGAVLQERFERANTSIAADFRSTDVKADADVAAEDAMLPIVQEAFPDHEIYAEESGTHEGSADFRWIIDPLDGTNNFAAGLPSFASAVAVERAGEPYAAAVHVPTTGETYVAGREAGVRYATAGDDPTVDGEQVTADSGRSLAQSTVVSVIGHDVAADEALRARADELHRAVEGAAKRRLESWSPTVHWGLLARGRLDGVVAFQPDEEEQIAGELFATESGMALDREVDEGVFLAAATAELLADLRSGLPL